MLNNKSLELNVARKISLISTNYWKSIYIIQLWTGNGNERKSCKLGLSWGQSLKVHLLAILIQGFEKNLEILFVIQIKTILTWIRVVGWIVFLFYQDDLNKKYSFGGKKFSKLCSRNADKCNFKDRLQITFKAVDETMLGWYD